MKKYIRVALIITLIAFMLCICGCGEVKDAQNKLEGMLDTLKKGDYVSALEDYVCDKEENRDFPCDFKATPEKNGVDFRCVVVLGWAL